MDYLEIAKKIEIDGELLTKVIELIEKKKNEYLKYVDLLTDISNAEKAFVVLAELYKDDVYNNNFLAIYLLSLEKCYQMYQDKGISDEIFIETMKCFKRFIDECKVKNKISYFDRAFWTYRQTSLSLFRIGQLEYEMVVEDGVKKISIHIPSDAVLTNELIDQSINEMKKFIKNYYPEYEGKIVYCHSWLLSEKLVELLPQNSNILTFQKYFDIIEHDENALDIYEWVFKSKTTVSVDDLPSQTTLQKNMKEYLKRGNKIGNSLGVLKLERME